MPCPFPRHPDFAGMMRPGHDQSTTFWFVCDRQNGRKEAQPN